jgi:hypothetical protein
VLARIPRKTLLQGDGRGLQSSIGLQNGSGQLIWLVLFAYGRLKAMTDLGVEIISYGVASLGSDCFWIKCETCFANLDLYVRSSRSGNSEPKAEDESNN